MHFLSTHNFCAHNNADSSITWYRREYEHASSQLSSAIFVKCIKINNLHFSYATLLKLVEYFMFLTMDNGEWRTSQLYCLVTSLVIYKKGNKIAVYWTDTLSQNVIVVFDFTSTTTDYKNVIWETIFVHQHTYLLSSSDEVYKLLLLSFS